MLKNKQKWRYGIQIFFFVLVGIIAFNHTLVESGAAIPFISEASVHAICPFGGVETLYQLWTTGDYIQKIHSSALVLMGIVFTLTLLFGPVLCGWICPLGSIQEWIGKIGKKIFKSKYNHFIPKGIDKVLRYLRYVLLVLVLYNTAMSGILMFANADPFFALYHFWTGETAVAALIILVITLLASLVVERPWCKYACPYGALLGLMNPIRLFKIKRNATSCISCNNCSHQCPMNIDVANAKSVSDHQCISCLKCTSETSCPIPETVQLMPLMAKTTLGKKTPSMSLTTLGIITLILFFAGILSTSLTGVWSTQNTKLPDKIQVSTGSEVYDPESIRGSYTLEQISDYFEIPVSDLLAAFELPADSDPKVIKSKDIETQFENSAVPIGNDSVKVFVALYKNLPIGLADNYLPESAVKLILQNNLQLTSEQKKYLESHTLKSEAVVLPSVTESAQTPVTNPTETQTAQTGTSQTTTKVPATVAPSAKAPTTVAPPPTPATVVPTTKTPATTTETTPKGSQTSEEPAINGQSTFQAVLDLGISQEQIESVLNGPMPAKNMTVRGYCQDNGLSFSEVKAALNEYLK